MPAAIASPEFIQAYRKKNAKNNILFIIEAPYCNIDFIILKSIKYISVTQFSQWQEVYSNFQRTERLSLQQFLKEFTMKTQKDKQILLSRRNFILTAFMCTLLINKLISNHKNVEESPQSLNKDEGFVIFAGWVLLNDDLVENLR